MRRWMGRLAVASAIMGLWVSSARAGQIAPPPAPSHVAVAAPKDVRILPVVYAGEELIPRIDEAMGPNRDTALCIGPAQHKLIDFADRWSKATLSELFNREIGAAGFTVGQSNALFRGGAVSTDLQVAVSIKRIRMDTCAPRMTFSGRGWASFEVEWQVYSPLERRVVARAPVVGVFEQKDVVPKIDILTGAFADSVRALINDQRFRDVVLAPEAGVTAGVGAPPALAGAGRAANSATGDRTPIILGAPERKPDGLQEVVGSVVTVVDGGGHGSGFLVSADGYILTNEHVVGASKTVKIRWSDNFETVGEVLRTDKGRDVALIKTNSRGRLPLSMRRAAPALGQDVWAVGSPMDIGLSGSVTKGIVSTTNRIYDGYAFIQSDVQVTHGNSGGPLVTKDGEVVGLTDIGFRPDGLPNAVNLFIPAGDAMDFLGLK